MSNPKDINNMSPDKNPDDVHFTPSAHRLQSQQKIDIAESELGREQGQTPAEEQISGHLLSQIDTDNTNQPLDEINEDDVRDQKNSTIDWDAENNRTGRRK